MKNLLVSSLLLQGQCLHYNEILQRKELFKRSYLYCEHLEWSLFFSLNVNENQNQNKRKLVMLSNLKTLNRSDVLKRVLSYLYKGNGASYLKMTWDTNVERLLRNISFWETYTDTECVSRVVYTGRVRSRTEGPSRDFHRVSVETGVDHCLKRSNKVKGPHTKLYYVLDWVHYPDV